MFIVLQQQEGKRAGDTMILDSVAGHRKTFETLTAFLASRDPALEIATAETCHPRPDWPSLRAYRMVKSSGKVKVEELPDGVLQVSGRPELLARYVTEFNVDPGKDGGHVHPEHPLAFDGELDHRLPAPPGPPEGDDARTGRLSLHTVAGTRRVLPSRALAFRRGRRHMTE
jgi:hypothetical protein